VFSPIGISPPFTVEDDHNLGKLVAPKIEKNNGELNIDPVFLNGEYVFHVGGDENVVNYVIKKLVEVMPLAVKIDDAIIRMKVEKIVDITKEVKEKISSISNTVRIYIKSPAQIFNIYAPSKVLKFTPSAVEVLFVPFALARGEQTLTTPLVLSALKTLGNFVETWYSLRTLQPCWTWYRDKPEINLCGHVTYIITKKTTELETTLITAELTGIGRSRMNGFGTTTVT